MVTVFLSYAPQDREIAATTAARLERGAEATVLLSECRDHTVAEDWEGGQYCAAVLLLLSPDSVPARLRREDWESLLGHISGNAEPPVAAMLVRPCAYPRLLERKNFFHWAECSTEALRAIERWGLSLQPSPERRAYEPACLPWFQGRQRELALLWETLVDGAGSAVALQVEPGSGKTSLAQEFARQAGEQFRDVIWVACGSRPWESILGELASRLEVPLDAVQEESVAMLETAVGKHRLLLILDDASGCVPMLPRPDGLASILITTRSEDLALARPAVAIRLERLRREKIEAPENPAELRLWQAMAVCRPDGFPLELPAEAAGMELPDARARANA